MGAQIKHGKKLLLGAWDKIKRGPWMYPLAARCGERLRLWMREREGKGKRRVCVRNEQGGVGGTPAISVYPVRIHCSNGPAVR